MSNTSALDTQPCVIQSYDDLLRGWVKENFYGVKYGAKRLAAMAGVSTRTAENWVQGRTIPHTDDVLNLCVECDDLVGLLIGEVQRRKAAKKTA